MLGALVVPAALVGLLLFLVRNGRPLRGEGSRGARSPKSLRRYGRYGVEGTFESPGWLAGVFVAGLAAASFASRFPIAAELGVVAGLAGALWPKVGSRVLDLIGLAGSGATGHHLLFSNADYSASYGARFSSLVLVVVLFVPAAFAARRLPGNRSSAFTGHGLALFAAVDVVSFLSTPLGVPILGSGSLSLVGASAIAALMFGFAFGYAPWLGALLLGAGVAVASAGTSAVIGAPGTIGGSWSQLALAIAFVAAAVALRTVCGRFAISR